jgi:hypothetical protein
MAQNGRFLGAKCDPDVFFMNIGGFRGAKPANRMSFFDLVEQKAYLAVSD